jgi:biopolymer transport protein ExbD
LGLTPLIDVVFILLIFFMLSTVFARESGLTVTAPANGAAAPQTHSVHIKLTTNGGILFKGAAHNLRTLTQRLKPAFRDRPEMPVIVSSQSDASYQRMVAVLDALKAAGAARIAVREETHR